MYDQLNFTLDNIIYNSEVVGTNDIEIILPCKNPASTTIESAVTKERVTILKPVVQIKIKLFLSVRNYIPKLYIHGSKYRAKISYSNQINLNKNTTAMLTFTTTDGGNEWLVGFSDFSTTPSSSTAVTSVNGVSGPTVILDASKIHLEGEKGPTIIQQFNTLDSKIDNMSKTLVSEVTGEVVKILPDMIETKIKDTTIIAEKI